jgi:hypothetical protein
MGTIIHDDDIARADIAVEDSSLIGFPVSCGVNEVAAFYEAEFAYPAWHRRSR